MCRSSVTIRGCHTHLQLLQFPENPALAQVVQFRGSSSMEGWNQWIFAHFKPVRKHLWYGCRISRGARQGGPGEITYVNRALWVNSRALSFVLYDYLCIIKHLIHMNFFSQNFRFEWKWMQVISTYLIFAANLSNRGVSIISSLRHKSVQMKQISHKLTGGFSVCLPDFVTKLQTEWQRCMWLHTLEFYL